MTHRQARVSLFASALLTTFALYIVLTSTEPRTGGLIPLLIFAVGAACGVLKNWLFRETAS